MNGFVEQDLRWTRFVVLVRRHLQQEVALTQSLEAFNERTKSALSQTGLRGLDPTGLDEIQSLSRSLEELAEQVRHARTSLIKRINESFGTDLRTLGQFINKIPIDQAAEITRVRDEISERFQDAQGIFVQNQVSLHYSVHFHRRYLHGVLQSADSDDRERGVYHPEGVNEEIPAGNLYRRTC